MQRFGTTRWSLLIDARGQSTQATHALDQLCRIYRPPVLTQIRRSGCTAADAEDLAQTFFEQFLRQRLYAAADPARGRFRVYIQVALRHFLTSHEISARRLKRGGGQSPLSLDSAAYQSVEVADEQTPDAQFDRDWANAVIAEALLGLREEASQSGKLALFDALRPFLFESPNSADYTRLLDTLGLRRNTLAVALHRLRRRLHERVCAELTQTLSDPADLPDELSRLQQVQQKVAGSVTTSD